MKRSRVLRELSGMYKVEEQDIPKTLQRFKREVEEMEKALRSDV